jgi:hypothetical protein
VASANGFEITMSDVGDDSTLILKREIDLGTAPLLDAEGPGWQGMVDGVSVSICAT